ncbi:MAG: hypothetical protein ACJ8AW_10120 [Rhodopila sp.]|jgi:hypothetical protein
MNDDSSPLMESIATLVQTTTLPDVSALVAPPAESATEAFAAGQQSAAAALKTLLAEAPSKSHRRRLLRGGVALRVATHHLEAELIRFVDNDLASAIAKLIAKRLVSLCDNEEVPDEMPAAVATEAKPLLEPVTTVETAHFFAVRFVLEQFVVCLTEFKILDQSSETIREMVAHRGLLIAYDLLVVHYERAEAANRAAVIVAEAMQTLRDINRAAEKG